jgi:predicted AlkP superfamily phosphohydrolase/phosphomutase
MQESAQQKQSDHEQQGSRKVLIIGLDGATFDVLKPMMNSGRMPNLKRFIQQGASGICKSTVPPITPAAWTTFMTGKGPGRHGIIDFERYDVSTGKLSFNSSFEIREKTIWKHLSEKGLRVGSLWVPMTYPPYKVNGFLISGFETPNTERGFTYPADLKEELLTRWPEYSYKSRWRRKALGGDELFQNNLQHIKRSFQQGYEIVTTCGERFGWDVLMVMYKLVDNLQHKTWKYLDPRTRDRYPQRAEMVAETFAALDEVLGKLFQYASEQQADVLIMSDHGHGSLEGKAQPNLLLKQWGYLSIKSPLIQARKRAAKIINRSLGRTKKRFEANLGIESDLVLDWSQTKACVMHAGMNGFLYLNLKGRQPGGVVEQNDYEKLRDELIENFQSVTVNDRNGEAIQVYPEVHKPEELYNCRREDQPWLPDLLLVPHPGLSVVRKIRGNRPVVWSSLRRMEGTHRLEGVFAAGGENIRAGAEVKGQLADIAPTLLTMLGLPVPEDMEGRVLTDAFKNPPQVEYEKSEASQVAEKEEVYSDAEKEALTRRLADLGYLE